MEVIILPSAADVDRVATSRIAAVVARKPSAVIGLATGSSPQGIYTRLRRNVEAGRTSFTAASAFALDEYVGIPRDDPRSYASTLAHDVVTPLGFDPERVHVPDGCAVDLQAAADEYDSAIAAAGGIDIQILGIGSNGHIGFNEPASSFASRTRIKTLAPQTRADNARFFASPAEVPLHCITQGLGTILEARELLLVARGSVKAHAIAAAVEGPLSAFIPASALQLHEHATVIIDEDAAAELTLADYYRYAYAHKPEWQRSDKE